MAVRLNYRNHAAEGNFRRILVGLRKLKMGNGGKQEMKKEDTEMMLRILKRRGQDMPIFIRVMEGSGKRTISRPRQKISQIISAATFLKPKRSSSQICVDRLILDTCGYLSIAVPNQEFCKEIHPFLIPIQMGEKDAGEVLSVSRDVSEQYFREEDEAATMAEIGMM